MERSLAWLLFIALHCVVVHRWTRDFRNTIQPWLQRRATSLLGSRRRPSEALGAWLAVLVVMVSVFSPVCLIWLAGRFGAINWSFAQLLLVLTLALSATIWMFPATQRSETR